MLAWTRKYIDLETALCLRLKVAAAEKNQSQRAFIANAITAAIDAHDTAKAEVPVVAPVKVVNGSAPNSAQAKKSKPNARKAKRK